MGTKGLKLHPFYEVAQDWDIPVLIHCDPEFPPVCSNSGQAMLLDDVDLDSHRLRIIIAHLGTGPAFSSITPWIDAALWLACNHPLEYSTSAVEFYGRLRKIMDSTPISRLLFGADFPYLEYALPLKKWVAVFKKPEPGVLEKAGVKFSKKEGLK